MNRLLRILGLLVITTGLWTTAAANGAVTPAQLERADVVADAGATLSDADRAKLQRSADSLRGREFPVKYVVTAAPDAAGELTATAQRLRTSLMASLGEDAVDGVIVIAAGRIGVNSDNFQAERDKAIADERSAIEADSVDGAIRVADRLQHFDEIAALDVNDTAVDRGVAAWVWVAGGVVILLGVIGMVLARRAAKRGEARKAAEAAAAADDPDQ